MGNVGGGQAGREEREAVDVEGAETGSQGVGGCSAYVGQGAHVADVVRVGTAGREDWLVVLTKGFQTASPF